jgi:DNA polymerase V
VELLSELEEAALSYAANAVARMRSGGMAARLVAVAIETNRFRREDPQYYNSCAMEPPLALSYLPDIARLAVQGLRRIYRPGYRYKKLSVCLGRMEQDGARQLDLFREAENKKIRLMEAVDRLNARHGRGTIGLAEGERAWTTRREMLSPRSSTDWDDG